MSNNGRPAGGSDSRIEKNARGRPVSITDEVTGKICAALAAGSTMEAATVYAGVPLRTFYDWLSRGRSPGARAVYRDFVAAVEEAQARFEVLAIQRIERAGAEEWQADAWRLERRHPDRYGRRTRIDGQVQLQAVPMIDPSKGTLDELLELRRLLAKFAPDPTELQSDQRSALELLPGDQEVM